MKEIYCANNSTNSKYFSGKICTNLVEVSETAEAALCWACLVRLMGNPDTLPTEKKHTGYPRGWQFMTEFVDKDGNVFNRGVEQPELKGTKDPTPVVKPKRKVKQSNPVDFNKIKDLKRKIKNEADLKKKRKLQKKLDEYIQEL